MNRARINYWIDVIIAVAFVASGASGFIFLLPASWWSGEGTRILGLSYQVWDLLHIWGSVAMVAGVGLHLALHTKWILAMTRSLLPGRRRRSEVVGGAVAAPSQGVGRRRFLRTGAIALASGVLVAACGATAAALVRLVGEGDSDAVDAGLSAGEPVKAEAAKAAEEEVGRVPGVLLEETQPTPEAAVVVAPTATTTPVPTAEPAARLCVLCPKGLVNDPYPGRCRRYVDQDDDGLCDYSIPTPCG